MSLHVMSRVALSSLLLPLLAACALAAEQGLTQPLLLRTNAAGTLAEIGPRLQHAVQQAANGQASAQQLHPVSPGWFAFNLHCDTQASCRAVRERLVAEPDWVLALTDDQRRSYPAPPDRSQAR